MPALDLLLGTRRLRSEIKAQSVQLGHDIERVKFTSTQLRHTAVARLTSPLGLLSAATAGFITGKIAGKPSHSEHITKRVVGSVAEVTSHTIRSIGLQVVLPFAIEWFKSRFIDNQTDEDVNTENQSPQS